MSPEEKERVIDELNDSGSGILIGIERYKIVLFLLQGKHERTL